MEFILKQEALRILRENGTLLLNGKQQFLVGSLKNDLLIQILSHKLPGFTDKVFLLISDISQLYDYVVKIPEIAWDIVDYAEKPVSVIYPQGKNVPAILLRNKGRIMIQLVKDEVIQSLLKSWGRGVFALALPENFEYSENIPGPPIHFLDIKGFGRGKIIQLELNGEIKFIL